MTASRVLAVAALAAACSATPLPRRLGFHPADADLSVTRIVHGSLVVELGGTRVLVDPWFYSGFVTQQVEPLGLTPEALPPLRAVLLTHRHGDQLDRRALGELASRVPEVVARPELRTRLAALGFARVTVLGWWESARIGDLEVTAVPADHGGPENGYVLTAGGTSAYLAGDTRYLDELVDVATRFPRLDVALLPIGGERFLGMRREMGPADAARAAALLGAARVIPIGYGKRGAFPLRWRARKPVERFTEECEKRGIPRERIVVLEPGESWHYYR
jgi:L-ascorbate metabolism protein UlaG (beta-lactamase superfamily)